MGTAYLLHYNNYYNRIVKKENSLSDYADYLVKDPTQDNPNYDNNGNSAIVTGQSFNFIENDFIDTTLVVNWGGELPDYLVYADGEGIIHSRWFVVNAVKTRQGQLKLTLHRDVIVDHWDAVLSAPAFIERGTPTSLDDPAIFNNEAMSFNQIKTFETELPDEIGCPWVVMYIASNIDVPAGGKKITVELNDFFDSTVQSATTASGTDVFEGWNLYDYTNASDTPKLIKLAPTKIKYSIRVKTIFKGEAYRLRVEFNENAEFTGNIYVETSSVVPLYELPYLIQNILPDGTIIPYEEIVYQLISKFKPVVSSLKDPNYWPALQQPTNVAGTGASLYNSFQNAQAKTIRFQGTQSSISFHFQSAYNTGRYLNKYKPGFSVLSGTLLVNLKDCLTDGEEFISPTSTPNILTIKPYGTTSFTLGTEGFYDFLDAQWTANGTAVMLIPDKRPHIEDQPYDILAIPLDANGNHYSGSVGSALSIPAMWAIVNAITEQIGSDNVYDVQLLPYCPCRNAFLTDGIINTGLSRVYPATIDKSPSTILGYSIWLTTGQFSFDLKLIDFAAQRLRPINTILDKKIANEVDLLILNTPNYDGSFEFSYAKNGGLTGFSVDCLYTPYQPFIHIAPKFSGLYSIDYNDMRGATNSGNYSIPQRANAWTDYQVRNKNYQQMFNRQIQNIEVNNGIERKRQQWEILAGTFQGAAQGAQMGSNSFMGLGGLLGMDKIGAAAGAGISFAAGMADLKLSDQQRAENLGYVKDQFNMQMQNIQALPYTLTQASPLIPNIRYFPFLEYYTCTAKEVEALKQKIYYTGMTIDRIGSLWQYMNPDNPYLQGYLIRVNDNNLDYHIVSAINVELKQGVFIDGYSKFSA